MPEVDFDAYLNLLTRFLRLSPAQREEIRRELRAHLLEALEQAGPDEGARRQAIQCVLEDFGDAAELAARFSSIGRKRRWVMQGMLTAASIGFVALALSFLAPQRPAVLDAADPVQARAEVKPVKKAASPAREPDQQIHAALQKIISFEAQESPLSDVMTQLRELLNVNMHVQWARLQDSGISADLTITLSVRDLPAARVLRLILDEFSPEVALDFGVQDGVLVISDTEGLRRHMTAEVYDVRDLLSGTKSVAAAYRSAATLLYLRAAGAASQDPASDAADAAANPDGLIGLLQNMVEPDTWNANGGSGQIELYRGVLVVRQFPDVHNEISRLLEELRESFQSTPD